MKFIDIVAEAYGLSYPPFRILLNIDSIVFIRPLLREGEVIASSLIYLKNDHDGLVTKLTLDELAELIALARKS